MKSSAHFLLSEERLFEIAIMICLFLQLYKERKGVNERPVFVTSFQISSAMNRMNHTTKPGNKISKHASSQKTKSILLSFDSEFWLLFDSVVSRKTVIQD